MKHIIGIIAGTIAGAVIGYMFARKNEKVVCCCDCEDDHECPDFVETPVNKSADDDTNDSEEAVKDRIMRQFEAYNENRYGG